MLVTDGHLAPTLPHSRIYTLPHIVSAFSKGQFIADHKKLELKVLEEDEDVRYWVGGIVAEIVHGEALVKLDRPQYGITSIQQDLSPHNPLFMLPQFVWVILLQIVLLLKR